MKQGNTLSDRINNSLGKAQNRQNFRSAMSGLMEKRAAQFPDDEKLAKLRDRGREIRANSLRNLPYLLIELEKTLTENGIQVHWANNSFEANQIIVCLLQQNDAKSVVKGKSMVSEEIELNSFLEGHGISVLESDLGEFIIQLADETPSHIIMPAIHKTKKEIAELLHEHFPELPYTEDVDQLTQSARKILRNKFNQADAGISGVNFAVAETGTLCLVENEGNGGMSSTVPPLHIAITGIEKVVEKLADVPPLLNLLTKSATGQTITTYFNMISRPRQPGEKDGPEAVHLVLLDNGRSKIYGNSSLQEILHCIRCGSCINHCPVYVQLGGHAYGTVYPGPIGCALEPMRLGINKVGGLTSLCTLCGACEQVCPVQIPLPKLINRLRAESVLRRADYTSLIGAGSMRKPLESWGWRIWKWIYRNPAIYRVFSLIVTRTGELIPARMGRWARYRFNPKPARRTMHELAREAGFDNE